MTDLAGSLPFFGIMLNIDVSDIRRIRFRLRLPRGHRVIQLRVQTGTSSYTISVGNRAWQEVGRLCRREKYSSVFIVTESRIWRAWGQEVPAGDRLHSASVILVPPGERSKSLAGVKALAQKLVKRRADRESAVVVLGGGVVGDLAGFVASIYMRGIDTIQAPTTMVSQIDSAIGGKTGVNLPEAKNMLGTLTPPRLVAANPEVLGSLSPRAYRSGLYEAVKHGIIQDPRLFHFIRENLKPILAQDPKIMDRLIAWAAGVKVRVVNRDERESDLRRILKLRPHAGSCPGGGHSLPPFPARRSGRMGDAARQPHCRREKNASAHGGKKDRRIDLLRRASPFASRNHLEATGGPSRTRQENRPRGRPLDSLRANRLGPHRHARGEYAD